MKIKNTIKFFSINVLLLIFITACGRNQSHIQEQETQSNIAEERVNADDIENEIRSEDTQEDINETRITKESETTIAEYKMQDWEKAYAEYLLKAAEDDGQNVYASFTYSLIYVNDDDTPELVIDTGFMAGGSSILTFFNGEIDKVDILRSGLYYIERQNLVENSAGNMGYYYDFIYSIENGKWNNIAHGERYENYVTENGLINEFFWKEEKVTESTYVENINNIFDMEQAIEPTKYYIWDEILSLLQTGSVKAVNHRYELFTDDVTWDMAQNNCREKGGCLATILGARRTKLWL